MKKSLTLLTVIFIAVIAFAQAPQKMSYQAVIRNAGGNLITNTNVKIRLSVLQGSAAGAAVYVETHTVLTNANGLATVEMGAGTVVSGTFASISWGTNSYWIKTETDPTGGTTYTITGTSQLLSVPYALYSATSGGGVSGTGTANYIPKFTSATALGNSTIFESATGVGIGNITPSTKLGVTQTGTVGAGKFEITNTGSGADAVLGTTNGIGSGVAGTHTATTGTSAGVRGETNSQDATASAILGVVNPTSPGGFSAGVRGINNGTGGLGIGVWGSQAGSGWGVYGTSVSGIGVNASSTSGIGVNGSSTSSIGVFGSSSTGIAGLFQISNAANTSTALSATTNGTGAAGTFDINNAASTANALIGSTTGTGVGVAGSNSSTTGSTAGVRGTVASTANGIGAQGGPTGVLGQVTPTSPGGYSAGVRGLNNGTGGTGIGVVGYQAGSGWGVYGETPSGFGVYGLTTNGTAVSSGVRGETFSTNGVGVQAKYSGSGVGVALEVGNGAIKVSGVNKAAFIHTATPANKLSANGTDVDNPLCNGDPNCFLFVTQKLNPSGIVYNNSSIGVYYNTIRSKWEIFNENNVAIPDNAQFNVLVIKQ